MSALQRLLPVAASGRTHADCHQAVAGPNGERAHGGQLHEVQRSFAPVAAIKADLMTALLGHEQALTTQSGSSQGSDDGPESRRSTLNVTGTGGNLPHYSSFRLLDKT